MKAHLKRDMPVFVTALVIFTPQSFRMISHGFIRFDSTLEQINRQVYVTIVRRYVQCHSHLTLSNAYIDPGNGLGEFKNDVSMPIKYFLLHLEISQVLPTSEVNLPGIELPSYFLTRNSWLFRNVQIWRRKQTHTIHSKFLIWLKHLMKRWNVNTIV